MYLDEDYRKKFFIRTFVKVINKVKIDDPIELSPQSFSLLQRNPKEISQFKTNSKTIHTTFSAQIFLPNRRSTNIKKGNYN